MGDVGAWLEGLGLGQYKTLFAEHDLDFAAKPPDPARIACPSPPSRVSLPLPPSPHQYHRQVPRLPDPHYRARLRIMKIRSCRSPHPVRKLSGGSSR